jgi:uncharacterized protein YtpQ (UPF0354 family)
VSKCIRNLDEPVREKEMHGGAIIFNNNNDGVGGRETGNESILEEFRWMKPRYLAPVVSLK